MKETEATEAASEKSKSVSIFLPAGGCLLLDTMCVHDEISCSRGRAKPSNGAVRRSKARYRPHTQPSFIFDEQIILFIAAVLSSAARQAPVRQTATKHLHAKKQQVSDRSPCAYSPKQEKPTAPLSSPLFHSDRSLRATTLNCPRAPKNAQLSNLPSVPLFCISSRI